MPIVPTDEDKDQWLTDEAAARHERTLILIEIMLKHKLGGSVIRGINHGDVESQAELAKKLSELLDERERRERSGETHLVSRGLAIGDAEVNCLIGACFDSAAENGSLLPDELRALVKRQLGGTAPQQSEVERSRHVQVVERAAMRILWNGKTPTFREIARDLGVEASTVIRLFSDEERKRLLEFWGELAAALRRPSRLERRLKP